MWVYHSNVCFHNLMKNNVEKRVSKALNLGIIAFNEYIKFVK